MNSQVMDQGSATARPDDDTRLNNTASLSEQPDMDKATDAETEAHNRAILEKYD